MRRTCFGLVLLAGLSVPVAATAADNTVVGVGTGAVAGALVGGPIGAVVGAVAGGVIGANTPSARRPRYARRSRPAYRRRAALRPAVQPARLVERTPVIDASSRSRPSGSEIDIQPQAVATGSTQAARQTGWRDPR